MSIQKPTFYQSVKRLIRCPFLKTKHLVSRFILYMNLFQSMSEYVRVEKNIQALRQKFNEMQLEKQLREPQLPEFHYLRGYVDGIEFCIKGEWKKDA